MYYAIGEFYSDITELQKTGEDKGKYKEFFQNLNNLLETVGRNSDETEIVRLEMLELARSAAQQYATKFKRDGVSQSELNLLVENIQTTAEKIDSDLELKKTILDLIPGTLDDVRLAFEG